MDWLGYLLLFLGGLLYANSVPHFVAGISGAKFQSPFAKPPGVGESSPRVNVIWGVFNMVLGHMFINGWSAALEPRYIVIMLGVLCMGLFGARHFGNVRGGND